MDFATIQGDIAEQSADALVNASGTSLQMGSGVAGALRRGAEAPINEDAVSKGPVDLGEAAVTDAYELDAHHVIHAAAMPHYGDGQATRSLAPTRRRTRSKPPTNSAVNRSSSPSWGPVPPSSPSRRAPASSARRSAITNPASSRTSA